MNFVIWAHMQGQRPAAQKSKAQGPELGPNKGREVSGLGFGVWGLGFRVYQLGECISGVCTVPARWIASCACLQQNSVEASYLNLEPLFPSFILEQEVGGSGD